MPEDHIVGTLVLHPAASTSARGPIFVPDRSGLPAR
jgi:hypothetical protein